MTKKIVALGELMLRLSPPGHNRIISSRDFEAYYGGGEANVAISLASFGHDVSYITKLPDNEVGKAAVSVLKQYNVNTDNIVIGGDRIGIYFSETGASVRSSKVVYDRKYSSFSKMKYDELNFDKIFSGCDLFHISGITPALSEEARQLTYSSIKAAKERGCLISYDYNYRSSLWSREECNRVTMDLMPYIDILIGYIPYGVDWRTKEVNHKELKKGFQDLMKKYDIKVISSTIREDNSASDNTIYAIMYDGIDYIKSSSYNVHIVNRIGAGDAFTAGLLSEILLDNSNKEALEFAVASSAWKHTIVCDYNIASRDEIIRLMRGDCVGNVQR